MSAPDEEHRGNSRARELAWTLALAGFIPFLVLSALVVVSSRQSPWAMFAIDGLKTWSAVILSFLGGIRWGLTLRGDAVSPSRLALSVLPAIVGWLALLVPDRIGFGILLVAFCAQGAWDSLSVHRGEAPGWFGSLRIALTLLVAATLIAAFVAVY